MSKNKYLQQGFDFFSKREYPRAVTEFQKALEMDPEFDLALNALSQVYDRMGEIDKAIEVAKKLVAVTPDDPIAHTVLSRLYVQTGKIKEAEEELAISNRLASGS